MKIVIKVGTSTLYDETQDTFLQDNFEKLCQQIAHMRNAGHSVVLVTSGACGLGKSELLESDDEETRALAKDKQVCATVGQSSLMERYKSEFRKHRILVGQTLLAGKQDYEREITHRTLGKSINSGLLQIVNANDAVYDEQMRIGDNDTLSAEVAKIVGADRLLLVTDEVGFYENYKDEKLRHIVRNVSSRKETKGLYQFVEMDSGSKSGTGKMQTKLDASLIATENGCAVDIVSNQEMENLLNLVNGDTSVLSTHFKADTSKIYQLKQFCKQAIKSIDSFFTLQLGARERT